MWWRPHRDLRLYETCLFTGFANNPLRLDEQGSEHMKRIVLCLRGVSVIGHEDCRICRWRSILASAVLVLAMMLLFEMVSDPRSGNLRRHDVVVPVLVLFVVVEAAAFYAESRLRRRRPSAPASALRRIFM